jgi:hypothetical protein
MVIDPSLMEKQDIMKLVEGMSGKLRLCVYSRTLPR